MGFSTRRPVLTASGRMKLISTAKPNRVWFQSERWAEYAGQEVKMLEVAAEVERTKNPARVLSAPPPDPI